MGVQATLTIGDAPRPPRSVRAGEWPEPALTRKVPYYGEGGETTMTVEIVSRATGKVLDVPGGQPVEGLGIQQFHDDGGTNQQWEVIPDGGAFRVMSVATGMVLTVPGADQGDPGDGVQIEQFLDHGGPSQRWQFVSVPPGFFTIVSVATGRVLDVRGGLPEDQVPIQQFESKGGANQQWQAIEVVPMLTDAEVAFHTNDDNKDGDTQLTVTLRQDSGLVAARVSGNFGGFPNDSDNGPFTLLLENASPKNTLTGGSVVIRIDPQGNDTWRFNFTLDMTFSDGTHLFSAHDGVDLDQDGHELAFPVT